MNMTFWERVEQLLDEKGITKKTLSTDAGFDPSNISKGLKKNNIPSADTAVKIAEILGVSVEYLVTGKNNYGSKSHDIEESNPKYLSLINELKSLPSNKLDLIINLISDLKKI